MPLPPIRPIRNNPGKYYPRFPRITQKHSIDNHRVSRYNIRARGNSTPSVPLMENQIMPIPPDPASSTELREIFAEFLNRSAVHPDEFYRLGLDEWENAIAEHRSSRLSHSCEASAVDPIHGREVPLDELCFNSLNEFFSENQHTPRSLTSERVYEVAFRAAYSHFSSQLEEHDALWKEVIKEIKELNVLLEGNAG